MFAADLGWRHVHAWFPFAPPRAVRTLARQPAPSGIYASSYDPELAAWICARLAAGESLRAICRADASMPTEKTVWNWARAHPDFAAAKAMAVMFARDDRRALYAVKAEAREVRRARRVAERAAAGKAPDGRGWAAGSSGYGPTIAAAICDRVCLGEPLYRVCADPAMPSLGTVYNWLRAYPEFVALYRRAKEVAFDYVVETAADDAVWLGTEAASMRALERSVRAAHGRCAKLAPKGFADGVYGVVDR